MPSMRCVVVAVLIASTLVSCKEAEPPAVKPETQAEASPTSPAFTNNPAEPAPTQPRGGADSPSLQPVPTVAVVPGPPSPFLVPATPTQQPQAEAFQQNPPPVVPPPQPLTPPPPPGPRPWSTSANNTGRQCPTGQCFAHGKCIKPGGPIAREGAPSDVVFGMCGGDGGPCSPCRCVSTGTLLSTPSGEKAIDDLRTNDFVWSIHEGRVQSVRIVASQRVRVTNHSMARLQLQDGFVVEISGEHPVFDGRNLWNLKPGETLGQVQINGLTVVPYEGSFTYDILPDSDTGTYLVHGLWLGSTMFGLSVRGDM